MEPHTIAREKAHYHQHTITDGAIASATAIRKLLMESSSLEETRNYMPISSYRILAEQWERGNRPISWNHFTRALLHAVMTRDSADLAELHEITEGLEHRILGVLPELSEGQFQPFMSLLKTKRYTRTKLQRALLAILLGHAKSDFTADKLASGVQYIRVLGFTEKGRELLKRMRTTASLPVLMSAARSPQRYRCLELDVRASNAYMLGASEAGHDLRTALFRDYRDKPIIV